MGVGDLLVGGVIGYMIGGGGKQKKQASFENKSKIFNSKKNALSLAKELNVKYIKNNLDNYKQLVLPWDDHLTFNKEQLFEDLKNKGINITSSTNGSIVEVFIYNYYGDTIFTKAEYENLINILKGVL